MSAETKNAPPAGQCTHRPVGGNRTVGGAERKDFPNRSMLSARKRKTGVQKGGVPEERAKSGGSYRKEWVLGCLARNGIRARPNGGGQSPSLQKKNLGCGYVGAGHSAGGVGNLIEP